MLITSFIINPQLILQNTIQFGGTVDKGAKVHANESEVGTRLGFIPVRYTMKLPKKLSIILLK